MHITYNPCRLRFIICDMIKVYYEVLREGQINRRLQSGLRLQNSQDADSQPSQVFRDGAREDQVKQALEELQDALGLTDGGSKLLSRAARERLAFEGRPIKAKLTLNNYGADLELSTASLDFKITGEAATSSVASAFIRDQLIHPLLGYAASAEPLIDPPEDLPAVSRFPMPLLLYLRQSGVEHR